MNLTWIALAVFQLGSFVLHNHLLLNIGRRQSTLQGIAYTAEWVEADGNP